MKKRSKAFYRFCLDMANDHLSYYDAEEIESAVMDLIDLNMESDAVYLAEQGMRQHPDNEIIERLIIWLYIHCKQQDKAEVLFKKYENENTPWAICIQYTLLTIHGHPVKALDMLTDSLRDKLVSAEECVAAIDEMFDMLPQDVLAPYLVKAAKLIEKDADSLGRIASMLVDSHQYNEAIIVLERTLDLNAYDIFSWQDLARCYLFLQDSPKCLEACEYGLAIDEKNPLLGFIKGYIQYENKEYEDCISGLTNARMLAEGRTEINNLGISKQEMQQQIDVTYQMLGMAYMETNQNEKAIECFEILTERNPSMSFPYKQLANIALMEGDLEKGKQQIKKAIQINPTDTEARGLLVSILITLKDFPTAMKELKIILRHKPKSAKFLLAYAELAINMDLKEEADIAYRKLLKLKVKTPVIRQMIINYFTSIGDDEAIREMKKE